MLGLRLPRWRHARSVLGLNARNLMYVHGLNPRALFPLADDKIRTKVALEQAGVPTARTLAVLSNLSEVSHSRERLEAIGEFVIKPARGTQGGGILVIASHRNGSFLRRDGTALGWDSLRQAMGDILFGVHSVGPADRVLIEQLVHAHRALGPLGEFGLPDVRVILLRGQPVMAMMRVPSRASGGRANLHQGAVGVALRLRDGLARQAVCRGQRLATHADNGAALTGFRLPLWDEVLDVARRAARALELPYLGVDVVLDAASGALVMEANVRPGLEIQNVNGRGLRRRLEHLTRRFSESER